ncbi:MAG: hypothetical protein K2I77_06955 [Anaeroplasmataceae bacterium]|nr:hypothetical protein [Anaeroplasmataceae bacterium]
MKLLDIFRFIHHYSNMKRRADSIKQDELRRNKSVWFSMTSIFTTIFAVATCFAGAWIFKNFLDTALILFTIIIGVGLIAGGVSLLVWSLIRLLLQLSINHNWSFWLALIVFIAGTIGSVILVINFLNM